MLRSSPIVACLVLGLAGCAATAPAPDDLRGVREAERSVSQPASRQDPGAPSSTRVPPAVINGVPVAWDSIQPLLAEAAGGQVIEELVLTSQLQRELTRRGMSLPPGAVEAEERALGESLARTINASDEEIARLVTALRRARGLGELRYRGLLERNAMLRALVAQDVNVDEAAARQAYEIIYGERVRTRVLVAPTQREAAAALAEVRQAGAAIAPRFGDVAARISTDESASRGGQIEPFSVQDPAYPENIRRAAAQLSPGEVSDVIALERGYGLVLLEERLPPTGSGFEQNRDTAERQARLRQERLLMNRLARRLVDEAGVSVFDRSLRSSWEASRSRGAASP